MRNFVQQHPEYKKDSVVSEPIAYDLLCRIVQIARGKDNDPTHLFNYTTKSVDKIPEALSQAEAYLNKKSSKVNHAEEMTNGT